MMSEFSAFLRLGFEHIADWQAYDHLLFIITLCAFYAIKDWKKVLILVTAFTIGHSLTLALSVTNIVHVNPNLVELLIPITIMLTALYNVWKQNHNDRHIEHNYFLALGFGLIHGLGFSNYLRTLMGESDILTPLFAFNIGLELGQIMIVLVFFALYFLLQKLLGIKQHSWNLFWSGAGFGIATTIVINILAA